MRVLLASESEANLKETSHDIHVLVVIMSLYKRVDFGGFLLKRFLLGKQLSRRPFCMLVNCKHSIP